jgi:hypothetical protein
MFSARTDWELEPNRLSRLIVERRRAGLPIFDLTESNPTRCGFNYPAEVLEALGSPDNLIYDPSPKGLPEARRAIADYYAEKGRPADPEQILITSSTSEAYSFLFKLLVGPNERVLVPRPSYPLLDFLAALNDVGLDFFRLVYDRGWRIDVEHLRSAMGLRARALVLINPNNPTGSFIKRDELGAIFELCAERQIALICDEVFADYALGALEDIVPTIAFSSKVLTFALGGVSKLLGLPQMKLAWIAVGGPDHLLSEALERLEVISDTYLSVSTPAQRALPTWLRLRDNIAGQMLSRIRANYNFLTAAASDPIQCLEVEGGWYAVLKLLSVGDDEEFAIELLGQEGVLVHPGYFFGFEEDGIVVVSLLTRAEIFQEGVARLIKMLLG